jgi:hypothetical protein
VQKRREAGDSTYLLVKNEPHTPEM